jgi:hypothetical protein
VPALCADSAVALWVATTSKSTGREKRSCISRKRPVGRCGAESNSVILDTRRAQRGMLTIVTAHD